MFISFSKILEREGSISPSSPYATGLIKGIRRGGESKISFCYPRGLRASPQTYHEQGRVIYCIWSICRWLSEWWLIFVLLGIDATLGDGCGIWEHLHSFRKWNKDTGSVENFIFWLCVSWKSRELGGKVSPRLPRMESFSSDHLRAIISYWTKSHPESCKTSRSSSAKIINSQKKSAISAKELHRRSGG